MRHEAKKALVRFGYFSKPAFLIPGVQKGGTTLLYSILSQHPQIVRPAFKEAHFFDQENNYTKGYVQFYKNFELPLFIKKGQLTFEATPDYLPCTKCAQRIFEYIPNCKFIIVLRDPVSRAFSAWNMHHFLFKDNPKYQWLYDERDFGTAVHEELNAITDKDDFRNYIRKGYYAKQIKNYFKYFDPSSFFILENTDLQNNPQNIINNICDFLGLNHFNLGQLDKENEMFWDNKGNYKAQLNDRLKKELYNHYVLYDQELKGLLNRDFSWFKKTIYR